MEDNQKNRKPATIEEIELLKAEKEKLLAEIDIKTLELEINELTDQDIPLGKFHASMAIVFPIYGYIFFIFEVFKKRSRKRAFKALKFAIISEVIRLLILWVLFLI